MSIVLKIIFCVLKQKYLIKRKLAIVLHEVSILLCPQAKPNVICFSVCVSGGEFFFYFFIIVLFFILEMTTSGRSERDSCLVKMCTKGTSDLI